jgi:hypothetical protein
MEGKLDPEYEALPSHTKQAKEIMELVSFLFCGAATQRTAWPPHS